MKLIEVLDIIKWTLFALLCITVTIPPMLIVKEEVDVMYRHYTPTGCVPTGYDTNTMLLCGGSPIVATCSNGTGLMDLWWLSRSDHTVEKANWTLWTLVIPHTNVTIDECKYLHWHTSGSMEDEDDAKVWITQEFSDTCGTFVAHQMTLAHYIYDKYVGKRAILGGRGPIIGTYKDLFFL